MSDPTPIEEILDYDEHMPQREAGKLPLRHPGSVTEVSSQTHSPLNEYGLPFGLTPKDISYPGPNPEVGAIGNYVTIVNAPYGPSFILPSNFILFRSADMNPVYMINPRTKQLENTPWLTWKNVDPQIDYLKVAAKLGQIAGSSVAGLSPSAVNIPGMLTGMGIETLLEAGGNPDQIQTKYNFALSSVPVIGEENTFISTKNWRPSVVVHKSELGRGVIRGSR